MVYSLISAYNMDKNLLTLRLLWITVQKIAGEGEIILCRELTDVKKNISRKKGANKKISGEIMKRNGTILEIHF